MLKKLARIFRIPLSKPNAEKSETRTPDEQGVQNDSGIQPLVEAKACERAGIQQPNRWQVLGESVRGASHERTGMVNQDFIDWDPRDGPSFTVVLAVADGHGSSKSFRSDFGARIATRVALKTMRIFADAQEQQLDFSIVKNFIEETLPKTIARDWHKGVQEDIHSNPFKPEELKRLEENVGKFAVDQIESQPALAYGSTLLTVLVHERFLACLQLGDGDILIVDDQGFVSRPIPKDDRLIANETTSLSASDCWRDFRSHFQIFEHTLPAMILASTDGYSNAFASDEGFLSVGSDFLKLTREAGLEVIGRELKGWLEETSRTGSGDDVTVGLLLRESAIQTKSVSHSTAEPTDAFESEGVLDSTCDNSSNLEGSR